MIEILSQVSGVRARTGDSPPSSTGLAVHPDGLPFTLVEWDAGRIAKRAWAGPWPNCGRETPASSWRRRRPGILLNPATLEAGEAEIVAERVAAVLGA